MHLHCARGDLQTHLGAVALDQGHHKLIERQVLPAHLSVCVVVAGVKSGRRHRCHGAAAFSQGAHAHQQTPHVRVVDDGRSPWQGAVHRPTLHPLARKAHGLLVGPLGYRDALHTHAKTGGVHHDEHVLQATVFLTHQKADAAAVVAVLQHSSRAGLDTQLVLDADAVHIVASPQRTVGINQELGHHKQTDALNALRRTRDPRQHQMDDVLGHIVLTPGDVDLGAEHLVAAIRLRLGPGTHRCQVRAGLRLGQVHGAGPLATDQFFEVSGLELIRAGGQQGLDRAVGQQRAQGKTHVGRVLHFAARSAYGFGQALAAKGHRVLQALPAGGSKLLESRLETAARTDLASLPTRWMLVTLPVQGAEHTLVEAGSLFEHRLCSLQASIFKTWQFGDLINRGQMLNVEQHVLQGGAVSHGGAPVNTRPVRSGRPRGVPGRARAEAALCRGNSITEKLSKRARRRTDRLPGRNQRPRRSAPRRLC